MTKHATISMGAGANDNDEGAAVMITDAELDALVEAELAWERWERTRRWWMQGSIDDATSAA
ncbi:MAG: hypothetical protein U0325_20395 [Polyangiales bacterium]